METSAQAQRHDSSAPTNGNLEPKRSHQLPDLLTVTEVASYLRKTPGAVRQMIVRGQLPRVVVGERSIRIRREDLLAGIRQTDR